MLVNAIEGVVENGRIGLREDVSLPENTKVYVIIADAEGNGSARIHTPRLADPRHAKEFQEANRGLCRRCQAMTGCITIRRRAGCSSEFA